MTTRHFNTTFIFIFLIIFLGCTKKNSDVDEPNCIAFKKGPVTKVEGATSASIGQEIVLAVYFTSFDGCGQFNNFEETINGTTIKIIVNAKYQGCICTQDLPTRQTQYTFKKMQAGTYTLMFLQSDNNYLVHTIIVQ